MRIRRLCLVLAVLMLVPNAANAHTHVWDFFFGPSYVNASHLGGLHFALAVAPAPEDSELKKVSLVIDTSFHRGIHQNDSAVERMERIRLTRITTGFGVRLTPHGRTDKHLTSFQFLVARVWDRADSDKPDGWGVSTSLIYEYLLNDAEGRGWAFRSQGDIVLNKIDDFPRLSAGLAYHWK